MVKYYSITISAERKRGQHLCAEKRGGIYELMKLGCSNRAIAREINCSPSAVGYGLQRGIPAYGGKGRSHSTPQEGVLPFTKQTAVAAAGPKVFQVIPASFVEWLFRCIRTSGHLTLVMHGVTVCFLRESPLHQNPLQSTAEGRTAADAF